MEKEKIAELFMKGIDCSQVVAGAFAEELGITQEEAYKIAAGFGGGMGAMQDTCGAVTGMFMLAGMVNSAGDVEEKQTKVQTYQMVRELAAEFKEKNQSMICRELKGVETGTVLRSCDGCIEDAVRIAGDYLFPEK